MAILICILGRQPSLGLAELESLHGSDVEPFGTSSALIDHADQTLDLDRLGGTQKVGKVIAREPIHNWTQIKHFVEKNLINNLAELPGGKIKFGLSFYNLAVTPREIAQLGVLLKKRLKELGRSARFIPNQAEALSSAQVIHNGLTKAAGCEFICVTNGQETIFSRTTDVQDIESYAARDFNRPKRDAKVGMMPPKLAQIMINLAHPAQSARLLDSFCGTGVILQEAMLMGLTAYGSDVNQRMVDYSDANLSWFQKRSVNLPDYEVELGDATNHKWSPPIDVVVSEVYLGKPLLKELSDTELKDEINQVNSLVEKFLANLAHQIKPKTMVCLAIPAWSSHKGFISLPLLDHLGEIGYNHVSFNTVSSDQLLYYRPNQLVARKLLVLSRK